MLHGFIQSIADDGNLAEGRILGGTADEKVQHRVTVWGGRAFALPFLCCLGVSIDKELLFLPRRQSRCCLGERIRAAIAVVFKYSLRPLAQTDSKDYISGPNPRRNF